MDGVDEMGKVKDLSNPSPLFKTLTHTHARRHACMCTHIQGGKAFLRSATLPSEMDLYHWLRLLLLLLLLILLQYYYHIFFLFFFFFFYDIGNTTNASSSGTHTHLQKHLGFWSSKIDALDWAWALYLKPFNEISRLSLSVQKFCRPVKRRTKPGDDDTIIPNHCSESIPRPLAFMFVDLAFGQP